MSMVSFDSTFQRLKRRILSIGGASGAAWGLVGALGCLLIGIWLDLVWELSSESRMIAWGLAGVTGAVLLAVFLVEASRSARKSLLAQRLDETGQTGGEIVSGVDLKTQAVPFSGLSLGLAQLAISKAVSIAALVSPAQAVPIKPVQRAGIAAGATFLACVAAALLAPHLAYTEWMRFTNPYGDHPPYSPTRFRIEPGDTSVRFGDGLDVIVTVEGPSVDELELVLRTRTDQGSHRDEKLPMFFDSIGHWRATVSAITASGEYFVQARTTRSQRFKIDVITVPQLEAVRFRMTPPEYTRDAVYEGPLPQQGLVALAGTTVEVIAASNRPLKGGQVDLTCGDIRETIRLEPVTLETSCREVQGSWIIKKSGSFQLNVTDVAGQSTRDSFSGTMTVINDTAPLVRIVEPPAQSLATPSVTIPVVISAEDDYGVTRLQLFRSLNDSRATPLEIPLPTPPLRQMEHVVSLPLSSYGLQPGDEIKLFARVEDNDPAGPKGSESTVVVIQIVSEEELEQLVRTREGVDMLVSKYQEAQRRLEALQEEVEQLRKELEKRDPDGALSGDEKKKLEDLVERMDQEADAVREAAKQIMPYDLDKALNDELKSLAKRMDQAANKAADAAGKPTAGQAARQLEELQQQLAQEKKDLKEGVNDPLEKLGEIYPLLEDQNRFVELYHRQQDLADRLNSLKDQNSPSDPSVKSRMRELESEQRRNREDLEQLANDIEDHAARLPEGDPKLEELAKSSREFAQKLRSCGAGQKMSSAELGLSEFSGERGHEEAREAADLLAGLLPNCKGQQGQCQSACNSLKFRPGEGSMGNTLNQLLAGAGFKPGMGNPGQSGPMGQGGGYSARRSEMKNIGLYGKTPTRGNPQAGRSRGDKNAPSVGGSYRADSQEATSNRIDPHGMLRSSGVSETAVPARYRGRVQQYFQIIAEEAGQQK